MRQVAILIAVEHYTDKRISPVKYAQADAEELRLTLQEHGFVPANQTVLIDAAATKALIESRIRKILASLAEGDILYLYYAGHGFARNARNFITCSDTNLDDLEHTSVAVEWIFSEFKKSACKKIVLFLDSCESGMLASSQVRGIYTDLSEDELKEFFEHAEHCVCFAACKPGQYSYPADKLKHGIWTYHLIEALMANAPTSLEKGHLLTSSSLQNHLSTQVPRTLRSALTGTPVQTPWVYGALSSEFLVADVGAILAKRKAAANPNATQLRRVRLYDEAGMPVKRLSGFQKTHRVPDRVNDTTEAFVARIAVDDVDEDVNTIHQALRSAFGFTRKELDTQTSAGRGSIITPYFDYEVTVSLNPGDPSEVIWERQVVNIREPDKIVSDAFEEVFSGIFDTLEFTSGKVISVENVIDQIEALKDDAISVEYDASMAWCTVTLQGIDARIRMTSSAVSIIRRSGKSPKLLIDSFFEVQKRLVDTHQMKALPFGGSTT